MQTMDYRYDSIEINSRKVLIGDIVTGVADANTPFEENTFSFIREWFHGVEEFTLQTSGSTGPPKPITFRRWQLEASARATIEALQLRPGMVALVCLDTRFVAGKMMLVRCFIGQMGVVAVEPSATPLAGLASQQIHFAALVPYQLQRLLAMDYRDRLSRIATVIVGGAAVSQEILPSLELVPTRIILTYGMTETLSHIAFQHLNGPLKSDTFHTLPGAKISQDGRGCLEIRTDYLTQPVITNDLVDLDGATSFRWLGRIDNVINTGGIKVVPESVEKRINLFKSDLNLHGRVVITSLPDSLLGEKVICVIEEGPCDEGRKEQLLAAFSEKLSRFVRPRDIFFIFPFPETASGKVDRNSIKQLISKQV